MKAFEDALGLSDIEIADQPKQQDLVVLSDPKEEMSDAEKDFNLARQNIISVVTKANDAVTKTLAIANDKEDARSFEVVNQLLNTVVSTSMNLMELHKKKPSGAGDQVIDGKIVNNTQNNIVFNGTPKQLKEFISKMKEEENKQKLKPKK